jgi:hypothetical protein
MGLGMLIAVPFMILVMLAVVAVPMLAAVWAARAAGLLDGRQTAPVPAPLATPLAVCSNCHRGVQADWRTCAYCGQKLV